LPEPLVRNSVVNFCQVSYCRLRSTFLVNKRSLFLPSEGVCCVAVRPSATLQCSVS